jgi:hypothetical protein
VEETETINAVSEKVNLPAGRSGPDARPLRSMSHLVKVVPAPEIQFKGMEAIICREINGFDGIGEVEQALEAKLPFKGGRGRGREFFAFTSRVGSGH